MLTKEQVNHHVWAFTLGIESLGGRMVPPSEYVNLTFALTRGEDYYWRPLCLPGIHDLKVAIKFKDGTPTFTVTGGTQAARERFQEMLNQPVAV